MSRGSTDVVLIAIIGVVVLAVAVYELRARHGETLSPGRASWILTPGVVNPDVTPASLATTICKHGWTSTIRPPSSYTDDLKVQQMKVYRRAGSPSDYQEDHLISLELGGDPNDPKNLWPEPRPHAEKVDGIENELNDAICSGKMALREAQRRISEIKHTTG
jgi:hypothetical protein